MKTTFLLLARMAIGICLLWAAWAKLGMPSQGPTLYQHWLSLYPTIRYLLPGIEIFLGAWLIIGIWRRAASFSAILVLSSFSGLLLTEFTRDHPKPCGCMGATAALYEPSAIRRDLLLGIGRNVLLISGACWIYIAAWRGRTNLKMSGSELPEPKAVALDAIPGKR